MEKTENAVTDVNDLFEVRTARDWFRDEKSVSRATLFGELWGDGEIAVVFGRTGSGKSLLAVQIAEAIARGQHVEPFENTTGRQTVVLLDLQRTAEQFIKRYSPEFDPETFKRTGRPYKFSLNLIRVEPKHEVPMEPESIAKLIETTGARVLVIDHLQYFMKYGAPREAAAIMRELRRLRRRYGVSILATMNTTRAVQKRGITAADLPCSAAITAAADSVFAVGRCTSRSNGRYIKHIKTGSQDTALDAEHVPYCSLDRRDGTFPELKFVGYTRETDVLLPDDGRWERGRLHDVKALREQGFTIRAIAEQLGMSRSAVHRHIKISKNSPYG